PDDAPKSPLKIPLALRAVTHAAHYVIKAAAPNRDRATRNTRKLKNPQEAYGEALSELRARKIPSLAG
ncbi:MAG TPA: hypothetical protein VGC40_06755, partial [Paenirhodobacter sp.]